MFTKAGDIKVEIIEAVLADCKFESDASVGGFDVALRVQDDAGEGDWWRGAVSSNYGQGKMSDRTQAQITIKALEQLGYKGGDDFSRIDELVGVVTSAHVELSKPNAEGKQYHNLKWLGGGGSAPAAIDKGEAARRYKAMMGGAPSTAAATAAKHAAALAATPAPAAAPVAKKNPFAKA